MKIKIQRSGEGLLVEGRAAVYLCAYVEVERRRNSFRLSSLSVCLSTQTKIMIMKL